MIHICTMRVYVWASAMSGTPATTGYYRKQSAQNAVFSVSNHYYFLYHCCIMHCIFNIIESKMSGETKDF